MPTRSLTVASVARLKPPKEGQVDYFDRGYPGLCLRVSYGGAKAWVYFYRLHGKLRRLSLGRFPGMELDEAHDAWRAARLAVSKGESPAHIKPTAADTFAATAEEWLQRDQAKNRSANEVRRAIEHDVMPAWGERLIAMITRRDVLELIDAVADRGALTMARRLHSHLHRLFRWAVGRGILEVNPMADLPKPGAAVKRDRVLSDGELRAVWKAAEKTVWPFGPAIRLLILTAARREEIGALGWSEIHGDEIRIPGERSKTGEPRIIPLSSAALALIQDLPRVGEYVFSANGSGLGGWSKAKRAIDTTAAEMNGGPLAPWRLHDIRRTTATGLQRLGVGLQVVESVLGHVSGSRAGIVGVYQRHQFEAEKRQALEAWAREIARIARGKIHDASATFIGSGSLAAAANLTAFAGAAFSGSGSLTADVQPIDMRWADAIGQADKRNVTAPLLTYLRTPGTPFGPWERRWLEELLERMQGFKRKESGRYIPLFHKSRDEIHAIAAKFVCDLQNEGMPLEPAIDTVARAHPQWYENDRNGPGSSLRAYIKRGQKPRN
jgi:integrase